MREFVPEFLTERTISKANIFDIFLSTVGRMPLKSLPRNATSLRNLLAFLDPNEIHESILTRALDTERNSEFAFLGDKVE